MPVEIEHGPLRAFSQDEFHELDHKVMGIVFGIHNEFGRFLEELLYKREIEARCLDAGIPTERELRVWVRFGSFSKEYRIDLVFSHGVIFEAKTAENLTLAHEAQTLNYLMLTDTHHGKLVNFRPERVQWQFISTQLTSQVRRHVTIDDCRWRSVNERSELLKNTMVDLVHDWGAFLECQLYRGALTHFLGGEESIVRPVPVFSDTRKIGEQEVHLVTDDIAFAVTAVTESAAGMRSHLSRFLTHTRLLHLHWINLNHHRIEFETLSR